MTKFTKIIEQFSRKNLWWNYAPTTEISVAHPTGLVVLSNGAVVESSSPDDHYRPLLEEHVGKQGKDWNWRTDGNRITIKIRQDKQIWASFFAAKWS